MYGQLSENTLEVWSDSGRSFRLPFVYFSVYITSPISKPCL